MSIGIFGGSFNPVHLGHLQLARELIFKKYIDKLVFVPVGDQYDKKGLVSAEHRLKMLQIATEGDANIEISSVEADGESQVNTIVTLDQLQLVYNQDLLFILGSDLLKELDEWEGHEEILERHKVLVLNRDGFKDVNYIIETFPESIDRFVVTNRITELPHTSTQVRKLIKSGKCYRRYLDSKVSDYIARNKLYT